jgi:phage gp29-like protein
MAMPPETKGPPALIMPDGRPLVKDNLGIEVAAPARTSVRTIQSGHPAQGLTPQRLARLLRDAEDGDAIAYYELAEEMEEKDLHYLAVLRTRKLAVARLPIEVEAADDSAEAQKDKALIETWLKRDTLQLELFDMLDAIGKGVSATEMVWDMKPDLWQPSKMLWRDPRWFEFDRVNGTDLLLRGGETGYGEASPLPAGKFITHYHPSKSGLPIRSGLARIAAWGYMFKNFAIKDWVTFLEAFGHPLRIGKYGPNESEENKNILHRALMELGSDAAAAFPETMSVEFIDRKGGTAPNDLWRSQCEYIDDQLSKAVLGQTNTTDAKAGGLGSGQAQVHDGVRGDIEDFDAMMLAGTLNRDFVVPFVMFNHGPRDAYPRLKIGRPDEVDVAVEIASAEKLVTMGVQIDGEEMRERAGLPAAKTPDSALRPVGGAQSPQNGQNGPEGAVTPENPATGVLDPLKSPLGGNRPDRPALNSQADPDGDAIDATIDEFLDDWQPQIDALLAPVDALIAEAGDLSEVQARLSQLIGDMDTSAFEQLLAQGGFAARLIGEAEREGGRA